MRLKKEEEILDPAVRKAIIAEIEGTENMRRKSEAFRRWQCYKDKTSSFVIEMLLEQFDEGTVREMSYSITNVSIVRKIINKLARVYSNGVQRVVSENDEATAKLEDLEAHLDFTKKMKTLNRMLKLQKNAACYIKPCPYTDEDGEEYNKIRLSPMNPYLYDVVEEYYDRTKPLVYIFSNFQPGGLLHTSLDPAKVRTLSGHLKAGFNSFVTPNSGVGGTYGDGTDQKIADKKEDEDEDYPGSKKKYIWWTDRYHFTTLGHKMIDERGEAFYPESVEDERILNPIEVKPIVNFAVDQDNSFWAEGGEDVVDAGITINSMLSQINHIGVVQGYGQFYMSGKDLPKNQILGVNRGIVLEYDPDSGDPKPEAGFLTANPKLTELMSNTLSLVALTLTTNDLSVSSVSASLNDQANFPSGIAMLLDRAESLEDIKEQSDEFFDKEIEIWNIYSKWHQYFAEEGSLDPDLANLTLPEEFELELTLNKPEAISTESEKLDNIEKRRRLELNTEAELLQKDQPGLTLEQAEEKLAKIRAERQARMAEFSAMNDDNDPDEEIEEEDGDKGTQN